MAKRKRSTGPSVVYVSGRGHASAHPVKAVQGGSPRKHSKSKLSRQMLVPQPAHSSTGTTAAAPASVGGRAGARVPTPHDTELAREPEHAHAHTHTTFGDLLHLQAGGADPHGLLSFDSVAHDLSSSSAGEDSDVDLMHNDDHDYLFENIPLPPNPTPNPNNHPAHLDMHAGFGRVPSSGSDSGSPAHAPFYQYRASSPTPSSTSSTDDDADADADATGEFADAAYTRAVPCAQTAPPHANAKFEAADSDAENTAPYRAYHHHVPDVAPGTCKGDKLAAAETSESARERRERRVGWALHEPESWAVLHAASSKGEQVGNMPQLGFQCSVDKGIKQTVADEDSASSSPVFTAHKKSYFQVSAHVRRPRGRIYVELKTAEGATVRKPLDTMLFGVHAVQCEDTTQTVCIEKSCPLGHTRSQVAKAEVPAAVDGRNISTLTVGRLHFSEATANNARKNGDANPDQRYFALVATLYAQIGDVVVPVAAHISDRLVVRASSPEQYEQQASVVWEEGHTDGSVHHTGAVGINTLRPDEAVTIHGNVRVTGAVVRPSDRRIKTGVKPADTRSQLDNITRLGLYHYDLAADWAGTVGREQDRSCTGVIAQELQRLVPEAVKETGVNHALVSGRVVANLHVVDHDRLFMESIGAIKCLSDKQDELFARSKRLRCRIANASRRLQRRKDAQAVETCVVGAVVLAAVAALAAAVCRA